MNRLMRIVAASVSLPFALALVVLGVGRVSGERFSPDSFAQQEATWWALPVAGTRVSPVIAGRELRSPLVEHWIASGYLARRPAQADRWDVVVARHWSWRTGDGRARWFVRELQSEPAQRWIAWSHDHAELAVRAWPAVIGLVREQRYENAYLLMRQLGAATTPEDVERLVTSLVPRELRQ
ncbi:MAG: hypothetical protein H0W72_06900 [Planctomycetes bacterium]|nr:hypothetical protein [Planctomycetota bacterium]